MFDFTIVNDRNEPPAGKPIPATVWLERIGNMAGEGEIRLCVGTQESSRVVFVLRPDGAARLPVYADGIGLQTNEDDRHRLLIVDK